MRAVMLLAALLSRSGCGVALPVLVGTAAVLSVIVDAPKVGPAAQDLLNKIAPQRELPQ